MASLRKPQATVTSQTSEAKTNTSVPLSRIVELVDPEVILPRQLPTSVALRQHKAPMSSHLFNSGALNVSRDTRCRHDFLCLQPLNNIGQLPQTAIDF